MFNSVLLMVGKAVEGFEKGWGEAVFFVVLLGAIMSLHFCGAGN